MAIRRNPFDDHYLLYPVLAARTLEAIGWEWAPIVLPSALVTLSREQRPVRQSRRRASHDSEEIARGHHRVPGL